MCIRDRFKVSVPDANAPFRLMKESYVRRYIDIMPEHYNLPNVILTVMGAFYQEHVRFEEISFKPRPVSYTHLRMKLHSPRGMMSRAWVYLEDPCVNIKTKLKMAVLYDIYKNAADRRLMTETEKNRSCLLYTSRCV